LTNKKPQTLCGLCAKHRDENQESRIKIQETNC